MVTLSDVARAAGVSLSTASRAINGSRDRTVKPHLRDRVLVAAAELNYSANATAQAMARGRTTTIGLMVHDITDPYFSGIAAGVTRAARDRGCVVTLATTDRQLSEQLTIIDVLRGQRVAALIMAGGLHDDPRDIGALAEALARFTESTGSNVTVAGTTPARRRLPKRSSPRAPGGSPSCAVHRATSPDANASRVSSRGWARPGRWCRCPGRSTATAATTPCGR